MADYIDRENAEVAIKEAYDMLLSSDKQKVYEGMNTALNVVHNIPAADVAEVRHGHWWDRGSLSCRCSCCGCKNNRETRYCPNCGARMDESEFAKDTNVLGKDKSEDEE